MKLAVLTAVYPQAKPYLDDFRYSLQAQDDQDFVLYVLDDGLGDMTDYFRAFAGRVHILPTAGTPAAIRKQGIRALAADGVDSVMFADCDDRFANNRVSIVRRMLSSCRVAANELLAFGATVTGEVPLLAHYLDEGQAVTWTDLIHGNVLGLSNTAAWVRDLLPHLDAIDDELLAFDWALFTRLLYVNGPCRFTTRTNTLYRQHGANAAGVHGTDARTLQRCVRTKAIHHAALSDLDGGFARLAKDFARLRDRIDSDDKQLAQYAAFVVGSTPAPGPWWSAARLPSGAFL